MSAVSSVSSVNTRRYWQLVHRVASDILNYPAIDAVSDLENDIGRASNDVQLIFYHTDPLEIASELTGVSPSDRQVLEYIQIQKSEYPSVGSPANAPADAWNVASWFGHLGAGSKSFWIAAAKYAQTHATWTFDDLAAGSGTNKETLRSYHRNSYRAIRAANAPNPLHGQLDANRGCNVYTMPDAVREQILRIV